MDLSGCLWCFRSFFNRPGTTLILPCGKETDQSKQTVTCCNQLVESARCHPKIIEIFFLFLLGKFGKFLFNLCTDHKYFCAFFLCHLTNLCHMRVGSSIIYKIILCYICRINSRLCGKEIVSLKPDLCIIIVRYFKCSCHLAILKVCLDCLNQLQFLGKCLVHSCLLGNLCNSSVENLNIRKDQLQIDGLDITCRINGTVDVDNIGILETAHYMYNRIDLPDIGKELVSESLSLAGTLYKSCNINKFDCGRCHLFCMIKLTELYDSLIRNRNDSYVWIDGRKRIVRRQCTCFGQ